MKIRIALFLLFVSISTAHASIVTWQISGHVTNQLAYEPGNGGVVGPGHFLINVTFDTAAADGDPNPNRGSFGSLIAVDISLDGQPFSGFYGVYNGSFVPDAQSAVTVENDTFAGGLFTDSLSIAASDTEIRGDFPPWGEMPFNSFFMRLAHQSETPGSRLTSDSIPGVLPDLAQFEVRELSLSGLYSESQRYFFEVSVDSITPVPVPAAIGLLLSGLCALGVARGAKPEDRAALA
jgi:hypothetical protein